MKRAVGHRPSPALVISCIALFVSLGGVSYGLATGSIGSREIKNSSIQGKDVGKNEITAREIARRSIDGTDIKVNRVGGNAVKEEVLESDKIGKVPEASNADRLNGKTADQISGSGPKGDKGDKGDPGDPGEAGTAFAYATVEADGTVVAARSKNITQANIDVDTQTGIYCFVGISPRPKSAMVAAQGVFDGGQEDVIATSFVSLGTVSSGDCSGQLQVRTYDVSTAARADRAFHVWFED